MPTSNKQIILVGAGLAGSLLAIYLAKRGFHVDVYERRPDMRKEKVDAGRSINLALSARGIHALKEVGLYDDIEPLIIPMYGRMIHPVEGDLHLQPYGKDVSEHINSISRAELNMRLMDLAEQFDGVKIHFNERCTGMNLHTGEVHLTNDRTGTHHSVHGETVIGTDGSASAMRSEMLRHGRFNYSQSYENHGYKELCIPPSGKGGFRLEKNALHIWPRKSFMMIALPNIDASYTVTLFNHFGGTQGFDALTTRDHVAQFFANEFPDAVPLMPTLYDDFFANPTGTLATMRCSPWHIGGSVALLGDAAHAMVPFFGQGMNAAFEDCTVLNDCIGRHGNKWDVVFADYQESRIANANAIQDLALENFVEMRDRVADRTFQLMKKVEHMLEDKYPEKFIPKYSMVSFHRVPYTVALDRGNIQEKILRELCENNLTVEEVDWVKADGLVRKELSRLL